MSNQGSILFLNTKNYVTRTEISTKYKIDLRIIHTLIAKKKIKFMGTSIGVSSSDGKYYENISEEKLKKILGIDIIDTKGLYNKSNLFQGVEMMHFEWLLKPLSKLSLDLGKFGYKILEGPFL